MELPPAKHNLPGLFAGAQRRQRQPLQSGNNDNEARLSSRREHRPIRVILPPSFHLTPFILPHSSPVPPPLPLPSPPAGTYSTHQHQQRERNPVPALLRKCQRPSASAQEPAPPPKAVSQQQDLESWLVQCLLVLCLRGRRRRNRQSPVSPFRFSCLPLVQLAPVRLDAGFCLPALALAASATPRLPKAPPPLRQAGPSPVTFEIAHLGRFLAVAHRYDASTPRTRRPHRCRHSTDVPLPLTSLPRCPTLPS
ncbi:hypothetical protein ACJ41O_010704 [Fusarium nematophilum]